MKATPAKFGNLTIQQDSLYLDSGRMSALARICSTTVAEMRVNLTILPGKLGGSSRLTGVNRLKITVCIDETLEIERAGKNIKFATVKDLVSFVFLHEVGHLFFPQKSQDAETAADLWAKSVFQDFLSRQ